MSKSRLDVLLFERGLVESRERARSTIMSGTVFINGQRADKPGMSVPEDSPIEVRKTELDYVSRGGYKLEKALKYFGVLPAGKVCLDCGASTGGFTDCLLRGGAERVYAVDVGYGQLAWTLRNDPRVISMERTNIRYVTREQIPEELDLASIDVSFISLKLVMPVIRSLLKSGGEMVCLIKPQFEAGRDKVGKKGVVRDEATHLEVVKKFIENAENAGFIVKNITFSPIKGPEGNIEYLGHLLTVGDKINGIDAESVVKASHAELSEQ